MLHIVFLFSDLMSYKETFQLFPQLEYLSEVIFLDDMTLLGYTVMADNFLIRSNVATEFLVFDTYTDKNGKKIQTPKENLLSKVMQKLH